MNKEGLQEMGFIPLHRHYPRVWGTLVSHFQSKGIQPFDFVADIRPLGNHSLALQIRYGENFDQVSTLHLAEVDLNSDNEQFVQFVRDTAKLCHSSLVKDYRAFMKAQS